MKDLTQGPILRHIVSMAVPMMFGMLIQTLYFMVDLYFVSRLGDASIAGVSSAGNFTLAVMALTQVVGVGTVALIAHAAGAKDQKSANLIFNQSLLLAALLGGIALVGGYLLVGPYTRMMAADAATAAAGASYLHAYVPGLALQFSMVALGAALRGTGIVKPAMIVQFVTVLVNVVLAPILIVGWGTGYPLGVFGAGLASTAAVVVGNVLLYSYYLRLEKYVTFHPELWQPQISTWKRILNIGLPSGGEFLLLFTYSAVIYTLIRDFGPTAQAGYGIGSRIMQAIFLPAMAVSFAIAPVAGQNFGARNFSRVRETFGTGAVLGAALMFTLTLLCQWRAEAFVGAFTTEPVTRAVGATFLRTISWNFTLSGFVFACSGIFQALGNTWPGVWASATRLVTFVLPAMWLSSRPGFRIEHIWYASVTTVFLQAAVAGLLVRREFGRRLKSA
jgi:putative MATE family efflux protein